MTNGPSELSEFIAKAAREKAAADAEARAKAIAAHEVAHPIVAAHGHAIGSEGVVAVALSGPVDVDVLEDKVTERLRTVFDPEIPVNLYDLGLIYAVDLTPSDDNAVSHKYDLNIRMTLTTPNCPVAGTMPIMVKEAVEILPELSHVKVDLVWDPPWDKSRMSDDARLALNLF